MSFFCKLFKTDYVGENGDYKNDTDDTHDDYVP